MSNEFAAAVLAEGKKMLGTPYVVGGFNCDLFVRHAFRNVGLRDLIGGPLKNVREFVAAAEAAGTLRLASSGYVPQPGDVFFWGPADGSRPVRGAGHMGLVEEAPSPAHPHGLAMSAYNPARGTLEHRLVPKKNGHLALFGFIAVPWSAVPAEPPAVDPEPPAPDDAVDPPSAAELQADLDAANRKIAAAQAALA